METDDPSPQPSPSRTLQTLTSATGPFAATLSSLAASSRAIPSSKDFHFYYNFNEFKLPIHQTASTCHSLLNSIASSSNRVLNTTAALDFPNHLDADEDGTLDWLVSVNDEILERFDTSLDEFERLRKKNEESGQVVETVTDGGFQLVYGRKKKIKGMVAVGSELGRDAASGGMVSELGVKVADKKGVIGGGGKGKVPFHIPTIRRPQEAYSILVNNSNQPFQHVWLEKSEDGLRFIHPLEKLSVLDFVDKSDSNVEPILPLPVESTPFKLVEDVKDLKELAAKLRGVNEFAVDLEHNQYRSFQGITCLIQISTRTEDFVVDTLKLRIHVGPYLREVFKDPSKKKVMHGADRDIVWLQRDFGIYVCNLFDTGQASRVMKLERNSLEFLLHHFCGITANKEYQNADWRLRPLTDEMIRYAREDTHYLLYIYDKMRVMLLTMPPDTESSDAPLVEVYKRSYDVCMQLYEKDLLTEFSYLHTYGLQSAGFNAQQLAIVSGLCEWRDVVARAEDESTGYILPNKTLLEIAKQIPVTSGKLRRLLKTKHSYVEKNLSSILSIIRHSVQNAAEFEAAAQQLKEGRQEIVRETVNDTSEVSASDGANGLVAIQAASPLLEKGPVEHRSHAELGKDVQIGSLMHHCENGNVRMESSSNVSELPKESLATSSQSRDVNNISLPSVKVTGATVQALKKPSSAFGALLGTAAPKRKFDTDKKDNEEIKLEKIRSSVSLPFHTFAGTNKLPSPVREETTKVSNAPPPEESVTAPATSSNLEEIIILEDDSNTEELENDDSETTGTCRAEKPGESAREDDKEDEQVSLSDLSRSFQKCFQSNNQNKTATEFEKSQEPSGLLQLKPFDYAAARKQVVFGEDRAKESKAGGKEKERARLDRKTGLASGRVQKDEGAREFAPGKRRQAFPASGNRSATFR